MAVVRRAEELGFSTVFLPDHFGDQLAPVPALMAAADATTDLKVGALVFDNDYKHPVVLAKEVATLDVLSGGRFEFGVGAGWMNTDYQQSGIPQDPAGVRISRMEEGVAVLRGLFADGPFSFAGDHYTITAMVGLPKPVQKTMIAKFQLMLETATEVHHLRDKRPAYVRDNPDWHMLNARN